MSHSLWQRNPKVNLQITLSTKTNNYALHNISSISDWLHNVKILQPTLLCGVSTSTTHNVKKSVLDDAQRQPLDSILNQCNLHVHKIQFNINFPLCLGLPSGLFLSECLMLSNSASKQQNMRKLKKLQSNTT